MIDIFAAALGANLNPTTPASLTLRPLGLGRLVAGVSLLLWVGFILSVPPDPTDTARPVQVAVVCPSIDLCN